MADSALEVIRQNTRFVHADVEDLVEDQALLRSPRGLVTHLSTLLRHHQGTALLVPQPDLKELVLERIDELASDIAHLGGRPAFCRVPSAVTTAPSSLARALGHVYVIEGSRLGAMAIAKQLQRIGIDTAGLRSVGGNPQSVKARWSRFCCRLEVLPRETWPEAASAAFETFHALLLSYTSLTPHHRELRA